jgi:hypothetical protein
LRYLAAAQIHVNVPVLHDERRIPEHAGVVTLVEADEFSVVLTHQLRLARKPDPARRQQLGRRDRPLDHFRGQLLRRPGRCQRGSRCRAGDEPPWDPSSGRFDSCRAASRHPRGFAPSVESPAYAVQARKHAAQEPGKDGDDRDLEDCEQHAHDELLSMRPAFRSAPAGTL